MVVSHGVVEGDVRWLDQGVCDLQIRGRLVGQGIEPAAQLLNVSSLVGAGEEETNRDLRRVQQVSKVLRREERQPALADRALDQGPTQLFSHIANYLKRPEF